MVLLLAAARRKARRPGRRYTPRREGLHMIKKLILCLDGTSNRYCRDNTNVVKLAELLDKTALNQRLYYQPGVGTMLPPGRMGRLRRAPRACSPGCCTRSAS